MLEITVLGNVVRVEVTQDTGPVGGFVARLPGTNYSYWGATAGQAVMGCLAVAFTADLLSQYSSIQ